jgi:hypothetical protein
LNYNTENGIVEWSKFGNKGLARFLVERDLFVHKAMLKKGPVWACFFPVAAHIVL